VKQIKFVDAAVADLNGARQWYNELSPALGDSFILHVQVALDHIALHPHLYQTAFDDVRRIPLHRFPYIVLYRILDDVIQVIGVMHGHSDPAMSHSRLS
jgi:plasmid stabilization system protein ParE